MRRWRCSRSDAELGLSCVSRPTAYTINVPSVTGYYCTHYAGTLCIGFSVISHARTHARTHAEDQYYNDLWEADRLKKIEREDREAVVRAEMKAATVSTLNQQLLELQRRREEELELKQREEELLKQKFEIETMQEEMKTKVGPQRSSNARTHAPTTYVRMNTGPQTAAGQGAPRAGRAE